MRVFNLSVLQPSLVSRGAPGGAMKFYQERVPSCSIMKEVTQFLIDYPEVNQRMGMTFDKIMDMERPYYLEWRKIISKAINAERAEENRRHSEANAERERRRQEDEWARTKALQQQQQKNKR